MFHLKIVLTNESRALVTDDQLQERNQTTWSLTTGAQNTKGCQSWLLRPMKEQFLGQQDNQRPEKRWISIAADGEPPYLCQYCTLAYGS